MVAQSTWTELMQQLVQPQKCMPAHTDFAPLVTSPLESKVKQLAKFIRQDKLVGKLMEKLDAQVVGAWRAAGGGAGGGVDAANPRQRKKKSLQT